MSLNALLKAQVAALDAAVRPWAARSRLRAWVYEFLLFGLKQAWACVFAGLMLGAIMVMGLWWPQGAPLARYDFLFLYAVAIQALLLALKLEHPPEALVIAVYHVVGTLMELFKTAHGSWEYPEANLFRIGGVPLFSGFMYACVGSYMARVWRLFDFRFVRYPPIWSTWVFAVAAYLNFFTHHYIVDLRWVLFAVSALLFGRTWIQFTPDLKPRGMPLIVGLLLVALFIWLAENISTLARVWTYPDQRGGWHMVSLAKIGSWYLLMSLSFVLVTLINRPRPPDAEALRTTTPGLD